MIEENNNNEFPLFVVAGMPRGGTTFLYHTLGKHPSIFVPFRKEVNYFTVNFHRGEDWYNSLFEERLSDQIAGDFSPPCFLDRHSLDRILEYNPNVKIILVIRDPVEWSLSFYKQFKSFSFNMPSFEEYLEGYSFKAGDKFLRVRPKGSYTVEMIKLFKEYFGDNLLMYDYSFFEKEPLAVLRKIEKFLDVAPFFDEKNFQNIRINSSQRKNFKPLSYLLSREWFIGILENLFPRRLTLYLRNNFDLLSAKKVEKYIHPKENILLAEKELAEQRKELRSFFKDAPVLLGSGEPFL